MKKLIYGLVHLYSREWQDHATKPNFVPFSATPSHAGKTSLTSLKEGFAMQLRNGLLLTPLAFAAQPPPHRGSLAKNSQ